MVSAVSLIGTAFAVGGSYFAVDSLRDILIAKTITTSYATRIAIASAAAFAGLMVISKDSASKASKQTKTQLGKQLLSAEEDDPNYMVKSDIHKIAESGIKMNVLMDEFPEADLPIWWKSKISVTASQADDLADNLGYVLAEPEAFDAELDDPSDMTCHYCEKDGSKRGGLITWPSGLAVCAMCFEEMEERDAEDLTFHDWSDQEMMTHGKDDSFEDWVEHEIDSHGNLTLRDWADDEEESHIRRYGAEGTKVCHEDCGWGSGRTSSKDIPCTSQDPTCGLCNFHPVDGWIEFTHECVNGHPVCNRCVTGGYTSEGGKITGDGAGNPCRHCKIKAADTRVRRHPLDRFTKQRKPSGDSFRRRGRRSALRSLMAADSDDDDDDSSLVPDREPSRGAPDLWFAERVFSATNFRQFTPQEALKYLRSGDNTVWLIDYSDHNYGDDEYPHYDYPIEDPDELETMIFEGVFEKDSPFYGTVIANGTSYDLDMWKDEPDGKHPSFVEWNAEYYEAECASCNTTHGFDFMCATCGICLDCDPCTHGSKARGPFTDRDAEESINECGLKGRDCYACRGCGRCQDCTIVDGYSISSGDVDCVDCSKYRESKESVAVGTKFTCDCGASCVVDADTEIAYGPGGYDLRCGRNDDCRGDEKVLGAEVFESFDFGSMAPPMDAQCDLCNKWRGDADDLNRHIAYDCPATASRRQELIDWYQKLSFNAEVFEAFSLSDRPVSVKFGPGTSGNAKMKATFTDASGDTKTTQFGYKGMSDFTKHKDEGRRDSYLARHGSKGQNQNWKDPTTAGALSRYILWEKTSLPAAKSAFKKRFNLRAEDLDTEDSYVGYQVSPFITETDRMAAWVYEPVYSDEDAL